jgi:hypothetical protein
MRCQSAFYNKFKMGLYIEFGWEMAVWEPKEKNSGWWRHLHLIRHFDILKKKNLQWYFFYGTFYCNPKFQLICIKIDLAMENLCLAAVLIFSAILFFFAPIYFFYFFLWFKLPKYIIRFSLNSIASEMTIAIILSTPLPYTEFFLNFFFPLKFSSYYRQDFHQIRKSHLFYFIFYRLLGWK